jgi:hypothetical protein
VSSEIVFIDTYLCPHCRAELETRVNNWDGWLRCPGCGLPSLPPEANVRRRPRRGASGPRLPDDVLLISDSPEGAASSTEPLLSPVAVRPSQNSPARLVFKTAFVVSLILAFIQFLDHKTTNMTIFGILAAGFFLLLLRKPGGSRSTG